MWMQENLPVSMILRDHLVWKSFRNSSKKRGPTTSEERFSGIIRISAGLSSATWDALSRDSVSAANMRENSSGASA